MVRQYRKTTPDERHERRRAVLRFIHTRQTEGRTPTHREIKRQFQLSSHGHVRHELLALQAEGLLDLGDGSHRSISLTDQGRREVARVAVPMLGEIAAGVPIFADEGMETVSVPEQATRGVDFALRVRGDSMIDAGIQDGDIVLMRHQETAYTGNIVAVLIDSDSTWEATLKGYYPGKGETKFIPANGAYEPLIIPHSARTRWKIIGKYVRHISERARMPDSDLSHSHEPKGR